MHRARVFFAAHFRRPTSIGSSPTTAPATALDAAQRDGKEPLTAAERDELTRLRRQLAE